MIKKQAAAITNHRAFTCSDGLITCVTTPSANAPTMAKMLMIRLDNFIGFNYKTGRESGQGWFLISGWTKIKMQVF